MKIKYLFPAVLASVLVGCGTVSQVNKEGYTDTPVFPELKKLTMAEGTWPNVENLALAEQDGVTRDQLYHLLGRPHFKEGFGTREWDYLFHFNTPEGKKSCQFKVLFDKKKIARSFHWAPEGCLVQQEPMQPEPLTFSLDGDVTFGFDSDELTTYGRDELSKIAVNLKQHGVLTEVVVTGHTDRIGSDAYNDALSQRRAETVRKGLIQEGIERNIIAAVGLGKREPTVQCGHADRADLIACLAPNRRVDIFAQGSAAVQ